MSEHASQEITIEVNAVYVLEAVLELDEYPLWIPEVKSVEVFERDWRGRALRAQMTSDAMGKNIVHEYEYHYDNYPEQITWNLISGSMVKSLTGSYRVKQGSEFSTTVAYDLSVDMSVSLPGFMKKKAAEKIVSSALSNLKGWCEKPDRFGELS